MNDITKKIIYEINDIKALEKECIKSELAPDKIKELINELKPFKVRLTYYEKNNNSCYYDIYDYTLKKKTNINSYNGYCQSYFNICFNHFFNENKETLKELEENCITFKQII